MIPLTKVLKDLSKTDNTKEGIVNEITKDGIIVLLEDNKMVRSKVQDNTNIKVGDGGVVVFGKSNIFFPFRTRTRTSKRVYI